MAKRQFGNSGENDMQDWLTKNEIQIGILSEKSCSSLILSHMNGVVTVMPSKELAFEGINNAHLERFFGRKALKSPFQPTITGLLEALTALPSILRKERLGLEPILHYNRQDGTIYTNYTMIFAAPYGGKPNPPDVILKPIPPCSGELTLCPLNAITQLLDLGILENPKGLSKYFAKIEEVLKVAGADLKANYTWIRALKAEFPEVKNPELNIVSDIQLG